MYPHRSLCRRSNASVLLATLCTTAIIAFALLGYLNLSSHQQRVTARSQVWNVCLPIAEAGVEEALTHCFLNFTNPATDGWTIDTARNVCFKTNLLADGYYEVEFTTNSPRVITSRGYSRLPGTTDYISRALRVVNHQNVIFNRAVNVRGVVDFNGNNVRADSYDSRDQSKSTGKRYDPNKATDKADILCSNLVNVGNANVWGRIFTPPQAVLNVGPQGGVGSATFHTDGRNGVQSGWWIAQTNFPQYPPVKAPFTTGLTPAGNNAFDFIFASGNYVVPTLFGKMLVNGDAVVYCYGNMALTGIDDVLQIRNNASLKLYVRGNCEVRTVANANHYAGSFAIFGLPTCTDIRLGSGTALTAVIYAPDAHVRLTGGAQVFGAIVSKNLTMGGNSQLHYDEALGVDSELMIFEIHGWDEL